MVPHRMPPACCIEFFKSAYNDKKSNTKWCWIFCGGGGRIRTIEAKRSRFTVCPLWPLGNSPIFNLSEKWWSRQTDSNPRPADYKSAALPTELYRRLKQNTLIIARVFKMSSRIFRFSAIFSKEIPLFLQVNIALLVCLENSFLLC